MSAFTEGQSVEAESVRRLRSFLSHRCDDGRYVIIDKGPLAPIVQELCGDVCMSIEGRTWFAELKAEEKHTGNIFFEVFSNRCLSSRDDHAQYGIKPGWGISNRADLLIYHFLDKDIVYVMDFYRLKRWMFGSSTPHSFDGAWWRYGARGHQRTQQKRFQRNETVGLLVPLIEIPRDGAERVLMDTISLQLQAA